MESANGGRIEQIALSVVDGVKTRADTWYNIDFQECTVFPHTEDPRKIA